MTEIWGNRRRTTDRSSKPDIRGMFRSEMMTSGIERLRCKRASKPSSAVATVYPTSVINSLSAARRPGSSSTIRILYFEAKDMRFFLKIVVRNFEMLDYPETLNLSPTAQSQWWRQTCQQE